MSAKDQLARMVDALPETGTLEEAFERLYAAFQEKRRQMAAQAGATERPEQEQAEAAALRSAWAEWSQRGPQGPIADDDDAWP